MKSISLRKATEMLRSFAKHAGFHLVLLLCAAATFRPVLSLAMTDPEQELKSVGITAQLGTKLDLSIPFTDETGKEVTLRELIRRDRPAIIIPAYYGCPRLCGLLLSGATDLLNTLSLELGKDFTVITASFDPENTPEDASRRAAEYRAKVTKAGADTSAWHFLVGKQASIDGLMRRLGFHYEADGGEYAHTAALFMITPNGELSQYIAGITFEPTTVRRALVDASQGTIGDVLDQVFLFCFRYDHMQGKYVWAAFGIMRLGGLLTLSFLALLIYRLWYRERRSRSAEVIS